MLVIWNLILSPACARSSGRRCVIFVPANVTRPAVGTMPPARHCRSVLLPEPLGPTRPCSCPASTSKSTPSSARIVLKICTMPRASSSAIACVLVRCPLRLRPPKPADAFALRNEQADQPGRAEDNHQQQQQTKHHRPDGGIAVGQEERGVFD